MFTPKLLLSGYFLKCDITSNMDFHWGGNTQFHTNLKWGNIAFKRGRCVWMRGQVK